MNQLDPQRYSGARTFFRIAGPLCLVVGFIMFIGMASSMMSFGGGGEFHATFTTNSGEPLDPALKSEMLRTLGVRESPFFPNPLNNPMMGFLSIALIGVGAFMTQLGYFGAASRYIAGETAPVARDTFNYMAKGSRGAVRELASAVAEGFRGEEPSSAETVFCTSCGAPAEDGAKYCSKCGKSLGA